MKAIGIYGAGGFAREVDWLISEMPGESGGDGPAVVAYIDDAVAAESTLHGKPVLSFEQFAARYPQARVAIAVGDPKTREKIAARCQGSGYGFATLVATSARYSDTVTIGEGSIICAGSVLTVDLSLGSHVHVNLNCTIGHDAVLEDYVTLAPGVHVSGNVHIKRGAYIGTGVAIINGTNARPLIIGEGSVIGANACVTGEVESRCLYAGVPAVLKKRY